MTVLPDKDHNNADNRENVVGGDGGDGGYTEDDDKLCKQHEQNKGSAGNALRVFSLI